MQKHLRDSNLAHTTTNLVGLYVEFDCNDDVKEAVIDKKHWLVQILGKMAELERLVGYDLRLNVTDKIVSVQIADSEFITHSHYSMNRTSNTRDEVNYAAVLSDVLDKIDCLKRLKTFEMTR